jgi:cGMP-dependent protein kinase
MHFIKFYFRIFLHFVFYIILWILPLRATVRWALGVLIFEMVNGYPPFYDDDKVVMYKNITDQRYYLPRRMSKECKDLVKKLLNRNPSTRLGMGKVGATAVKAHPWFQGFDWHRLATKTMTPPYVPKVRVRHLNI